MRTRGCSRRVINHVPPHHQTRNRAVLDQHTLSRNRQRRKTAQTAALPPPRGKSGSFIVSWVEAKRLPVCALFRIWWEITSLFPPREISSDAMAWVILEPFSFDKRFRGTPTCFFLLPGLAYEFILFQIWNELIIGQVACVSTGHQCNDEYTLFFSTLTDT